LPHFFQTSQVLKKAFFNKTSGILFVLYYGSLLQTLNKLHRFHKPIFEAGDEVEFARMVGG